MYFIYLLESSFALQVCILMSVKKLETLFYCREYVCSYIMPLCMDVYKFVSRSFDFEVHEFMCMS